MRIDIRRWTLSLALALRCSIAWGQTQLDLEWVNNIGSTGFTEGAFGVAVDAGGNSYVGGVFAGTVDFDPGSGVLELTATVEDPYLAKYTSSGELAWARHLEGRGRIRDVATGPDGHPVVVGRFSGSLILDITTTLVSAGLNDIFVAKYDTGGNVLWAFPLGANVDDEGVTLAIDSANSVVIGGKIRNTVDLDPGAGVFNVTSGLQQDPVIVKYDSSGIFLWGQVIKQTASSGVAVSDSVNSLHIDSTGNIFAGGLFLGTAIFGMPGNTVTLTSTVSDAYLLKVNSNGSLQWVRTTAGAGLRKEHFGVGSDAVGNTYMAGFFLGDVDFDPDLVGEALESSSTLNGYLLSYDAAGNFRWVDVFSSSARGYIQDLYVRTNGTSTIVGDFSGVTDFDPGAGLFELPAISAFDPFFAQYESTGTLIDAYQLEGTSNSSNIGSTIYAVAPTHSGFVMAGQYRLPVDFDPGPGETIMTPLGSHDGFLARYGDLVFKDGFEPQ